MEFWDFHDRFANIIGNKSVDDSLDKKTDKETKENLEMVRIDPTDFGINKGGLVTNNRNLGETELIEIVDNIYYETVDNDCNAK